MSACPRCATPHAEGQDFCLECGERLTAGAHEKPPPRQSRSWIWAVLGCLVVAAAGAAVAIAVSDNGNASTLTFTTPVAPTTTAPPATDPGAAPPPVATVAVTTVATVPTVPEDTATSTTETKPTLITWPDKAAWTVVLVSLPSPGGHTAALARAHQALAKGLPQVGVLDSGDFKSLNPGYYVVFSGVYQTLLQAETGARNARFEGFASAYPRRIVP